MRARKTPDPESDVELAGEVIDADLIEWDDDFQPLERQRFEWQAIAAALIATPRRWARIPGAATTYVTMINKREIVAFREGRWQAASRRGSLYVRYLGPDRPALKR